jgi:hypothetical protein
MIEENTTGKDGQEYLLSCSLDGSSVLQSIPPFQLSFLFYNGKLNSSLVVNKNAISTKGEFCIYAIGKSFLNAIHHSEILMKSTLHPSMTQTNSAPIYIKHEHVLLRSVVNINGVMMITRYRCI